MSAQVTGRLARILAAGLAAVPFIFGALRALQTGTDFRYLLIAGASFAATVAVFRMGGSRLPIAASPARLRALVLVAATLAGSAVAFGVGAASVAAVAVVSFGFSLCFTASWIVAGRG